MAMSLRPGGAPRGTLRGPNDRPGVVFGGVGEELPQVVDVRGRGLFSLITGQPRPGSRARGPEDTCSTGEFVASSS